MEENHNHSHKHGHHHDHSAISEKNLLIATVLNFVITFAEIIGGLLSNSLALLSDALHNLSDAIALLVAYIANRVGKRDSNLRKTFGYKRIEIIVALFNAATLIAISFVLFYEAFHRFFKPEPVKGTMMLIVASIGFLANLISIFILKADSDKNLNIKAAYIHLIGDTLSSVAVIIGGILIVFYKLYWIDPLVTFLIGLYILKQSYSILRQAANILMQATPDSIDLKLIKVDLEKIPEVLNIHHVHAWNLTDKKIHFESHVDLKNDLKLSDAHKVRDKIEHLLSEKYQINHFTIQFEYGCCDDKELIKNEKA